MAPQTWMVRPEEEPFARRLGDLLRLLRHGAGWTQEQAADAVGVSPSTIARLELGQRRTRLSTLREVSLVLGTALGRDPHVVLAVLVEAAGPALAAETARSEGSIARKRKRKLREDLKHDTALARRAAQNPKPVEGGPVFMLRRRLNEALDEAFPPPF